MRKIIFLVIFLGCFLSLQAFAVEKWETNSTQHFVIHYKSAPEEFIKTVEDSAEEYYSAISRDLGFSRNDSWTWDNRAHIYIYDDENDYVVSSKQAAWSSGSAQAASRVIQTFPSAHGFFDSVLPHELAHIIFREYVGLRAEIPLWFEEGIAMSQEKAKRWGADRDVKEAIATKRFVSLQDLQRMSFTSQTSRETVMLFYAEAASAVHFIRSELGEFKFSLFCRDLRKGVAFEQALEKNYYRFKNVEELNKAWMNYLKK